MTETLIAGGCESVRSLDTVFGGAAAGGLIGAGSEGERARFAHRFSGVYRRVPQPLTMQMSDLYHKYLLRLHQVAPVSEPSSAANAAAANSNATTSPAAATAASKQQQLHLTVDVKVLAQDALSAYQRVKMIIDNIQVSSPNSIKLWFLKHYAWIE